MSRAQHRRSAFPSLAATSLVALVASAGCASSPKSDGTSFPERPEGCSVQVFHEGPTVRTKNIGTVKTTCSELMTDEQCLRGLMDEACKVGADVVWGVAEKPTVTGSKKTYSGRAAHTEEAPGR